MVKKENYIRVRFLKVLTFSVSLTQVLLHGRCSIQLEEELPAFLKLARRRDHHEMWKDL